MASNHTGRMDRKAELVKAELVKGTNFYQQQDILYLSHSKDNVLGVQPFGPINEKCSMSIADISAARWTNRPKPFLGGCTET